MLNKVKNLTPFIIVFCLIEGVLGYLIQTTSSLLCSYLSFSSIALSFIFCLLLFRKEIEHKITVLALFFTLWADFFLCGIVSFKFIQELAMLFFVGTQTCYFLRIFINQTKKEKIVHLSIRIPVFLFAIILTAIVLKENTNFLSLISLFYYANLLVNVVFAFIKFKKAPLLAIGLLLFSLCDVFVGLSMIDGFMHIPDGSLIYQIKNIPLNMAWLFYVPSQTVLALSTIKNTNQNG